MIQNEPTCEVPALEKKQLLLSHHVRLVARQLLAGLFIYGDVGGLGKTRTVCNTLRSEGIEPVIINSHVTLLSLFGIFYQHRENDVILLDDCDGIYRSLPHLGLLRSALWGSPRIITYNSSQLPEGLRSSFLFSSRVIMCANVVPTKNADAFKALLSRCDQFYLSASNSEVLEMMRHLARNGFHGISAAECTTILDYIEETCGERQLSMRLLGPSIRKFKYAKDEAIDWRPMIKSQLETLGHKAVATKRLDSRTHDFQVLRNVLTKYPESVKDQQEEWCHLTGKSRATFYRTVAHFRNECGD